MHILPRTDITASRVAGTSGIWWTCLNVAWGTTSACFIRTIIRLVLTKSICYPIGASIDRIVYILISITTSYWLLVSWQAPFTANATEAAAVVPGGAADVS